MHQEKQKISFVRCQRREEGSEVVDGAGGEGEGIVEVYAGQWQRSGRHDVLVEVGAAVVGAVMLSAQTEHNQHTLSTSQHVLS